MIFPYARLVMPSLSADDPAALKKGTALARAGVGGFMVMAGTRQATRCLVDRLKRRSPHLLLFTIDAENGTAWRLRDAHPLPMAAALGAAGDERLSRAAGRLTARQCLSLGIGLPFAPVMDVNSDPDNPIIGTRAFGSSTPLVCRMGLAWIRGCEEAGALACAKHFPGHGDTRVDSHLALPTIRAGRALYARRDLAPFRAAARAGVGSIMVGHLAVPALDRSGAPASLSHAIVTGLLRRKWEYEGLVFTDSMKMLAVAKPRRRALGSCIEALAAGCDILLDPPDPAAAIGAVERALADGRLDAKALNASLRRLDAAIRRIGRETTRPPRNSGARDLARAIARGAVRFARGRADLGSGERVFLHAAALDGRSRDLSIFRRTLTRAARVRFVDAPTRGTRPLVVLTGHIRSGQAPLLLTRRDAHEAAPLLIRPGAVLVVLSPAETARWFPGAKNVLLGWDATPASQEAAANALADSPQRRKDEKMKRKTRSFFP